MNKTSNKSRGGSSPTPSSGKRRARAAKATAGSKSHTTIRTETPTIPSKQQQLAALIVRDQGATLEEMIAATGWLPHTTRAALTGLKKKGYAISSDKVGGVRTYRGIAPE